MVTVYWNIRSVLMAIDDSSINYLLRLVVLPPWALALLLNRD
jgi:hypothetical protein